MPPEEEGRVRGAGRGFLPTARVSSDSRGDPELVFLEAMAHRPINVPPVRTDVSRTGTVDDQDQPGDEREDENEAPMDAPSDRTEAPEEFEENEEAEAPAEPPGGHL